VFSSWKEEIVQQRKRFDHTDEHRVWAVGEAICWLCHAVVPCRRFDFRGLGVCEDCWVDLAWIASGKPEPGEPVPCPA
jgi:hypothetical protein